MVNLVVNLKCLEFNLFHLGVALFKKGATPEVFSYSTMEPQRIDIVDGRYEFSWPGG